MTTTVNSNEIVADLPTEIETLKGRTVFTVKSIESPLKLDYRGGLSKTTKRKASARSSSPRGFGPFGPGRIGPPPSAFSPFARRVNPFKGLEQTSNEISLTSQSLVFILLRI